MKLVPYGELGVPCSQEYLSSLNTLDKINKEIDKISLSDYEPVTRTEDNNDVVEPQSYIEWLNNRLDELKQLEAEKQAQVEKQKQEEEQKAKQEAEKQKTNILESKEPSNTQEDYQSLLVKLQQKDAMIERLLKYAQSLKNNSKPQSESESETKNNDRENDLSDRIEDVKSQNNPLASNESSKDTQSSEVQDDMTNEDESNKQDTLSEHDMADVKQAINDVKSKYTDKNSIFYTHMPTKNDTRGNASIIGGLRDTIKDISGDRKQSDFVNVAIARGLLGDTLAKQYIDSEYGEGMYQDFIDALR